MKKTGIARIEAAYLKQDLPDFRVGDTVDVGVRITEGDKERTQTFTGLVIGRRGGGVTETFTVRRIVGSEGVERTFPLHAPSVAFVRTTRSGKTRRAKLHYLRDRVGKATRLTEIRRSLEAVPSDAAADTGAAANAETDA
ncbi:MAG: 50S ribosomal protein L19 [Acidobacteria bacterium]|nr:50S ribosomal protein L19 [Planctomycetota bacterium]MBE3135008.1 50S ribosomal protein L19 [Acidobacteriota bacterium]